MAVERKQVTVLFADVVGSMRIAAALDAERLREIMHELFNRSATVVQRYRGTVDKFTGDGIVAIFGAPTAFEDHALRACTCALEIHAAIRALAVEVRGRDGIDLKVRIGLNSGEVIAGEIGLGPGAYTAFGHSVGWAQRMEAAADPDSILCSDSTARLVEHVARLGPTERVMVKGSSTAVPARRLEAIEADSLVLGRDLGPLVGRDNELAELVNAYGQMTVTTAAVIGEPGVGKSRLLREFSSAAERDGAVVVMTRCDSHTERVPLRVVSRLLRALFAVHNLDATAARRTVAEQLNGVIDSDSDASIVYELLDILDTAVATQAIAADARRRRLVEVLRRTVETRTARTVFLVEDLHWVDAASDDILAELAEALKPTQSVMVTTFRPEYIGRLRESSQTTISLRPLDASKGIALATGILGEAAATDGLAEHIAQSAAGNPFFTEEIVRDLVGRDLLRGDRGAYQLCGNAHSIAVPATVQAVLAARIDRLDKAEKAILNAGSVIGSRFDLTDLHALLGGFTDAQITALVDCELIDQIAHLPSPRYSFRHPLVRTVCYESQLTATRAQNHRRLAAAIRSRMPSAGGDSALVAHHYEAAGDFEEAYDWHMKSGQWLKYRDVVAARDSWERARTLADRLSARPECAHLGVAPRAQLASTAWLVGSDGQQCFDELRELAARSGDLLSLAVGMSGWVTSLVITEGRVRDAARLAEELAVLVNDIEGHPEERAEMLIAVATAQYESGAFDGVLQTTDRLRAIEGARVDDLAPAAGLAGVVKVATGSRVEGRRDLDASLDLARDDHPVTHAIAVANQVDLVVLGFDVVDSRIVVEARAALRAATAFGDPYAIALARWALGAALVRQGDAWREEGIEHLLTSRTANIDVGGSLIDADVALHARGHPHHDLIAALSASVDDEISSGSALFVGYGASTLARLLTERGGPDDLDRARSISSRLEAVLDGSPLAALELWVLQCRAWLTRATGDGDGLHSAVAAYRDLAANLDARGHLAIAAELTALGRQPPRVAR